MQKGIIANINERGFGFIKAEGMEKDLFFHSNEVLTGRIEDLRPGDQVEFEVADSPKGKNAVQVSKI